MGKIDVIVEQASRMSAINNLSIAIKELAVALSKNVIVNIKDCKISTNGNGIEVKSDNIDTKQTEVRVDVDLGDEGVEFKD